MPARRSGPDADAPDTARCSQSMPLRDAIRRSVPTESADTADLPDTRYGRFLRSANAVERDLWILVAAAMLVDVTLTVHGRQLGLVEVNPIARHALGDFGVLGLYGLKLMVLGVGACCRLGIPDRFRAVVPIGLAVPSLAAVCFNTVLIAFVLA